MTSAAVLIPWRSTGDPAREAAWAVVTTQWARYGWPVVSADDGGDPFSRAASINLAATHIEADVYVIADADTLVERAQVAEAIDMAAAEPGMVVAFDRYWYLSERGTLRVLGGAPPTPRLCKWYLDYGVSCCVAVSAKTWATVGGFDARFRAWGYEDAAFEAACSTLCAPLRRVRGPLWHLHHPLEAERPQGNKELVGDYVRATGDRAAMRALIDRTRSSE